MRSRILIIDVGKDHGLHLTPHGNHLALPVKRLPLPQGLEQRDAPGCPAFNEKLDHALGHLLTLANEILHKVDHYRFGSILRHGPDHDGLADDRAEFGVGIFVQQSNQTSGNLGPETGRLNGGESLGGILHPVDVDVFKFLLVQDNEGLVRPVVEFTLKFSAGFHQVFSLHPDVQDTQVLIDILHIGKVLHQFNQFGHLDADALNNEQPSFSPRIKGRSISRSGLPLQVALDLVAEVLPHFRRPERPHRFLSEGVDGALDGVVGHGLPHLVPGHLGGGVPSPVQR